MTIAVNGSVVFVDSTANNSSSSVTVPSGVEGVVIFWQGIAAAANGNEMVTLTLGGNAVTLVVNLPDTTGALRATGVGFLASPPSGSQTLAWDRQGTAAVAEGGVFALRFFDSTLALSIRDSDAIQLVGSSNTPTLNVNSTTADYVLGMAFGADAVLVTSQSGQTVDEDDHNFNGNNMDIAHVNTPGASTTNFLSEFGYGGAVVVSLMESAGPSVSYVGPLAQRVVRHRGRFH